MTSLRLLLLMGTVVGLPLILGGCAKDMTAQTSSISERTAPPEDPSTLNGMVSKEIQRTLGKPTFIRRDSPAELWQYRNGTCILDLFLYPGPKGMTVTHHTVRPSRPMPEKECVQSFSPRPAPPAPTK